METELGIYFWPVLTNVIVVSSVATFFAISVHSASRQRHYRTAEWQWYTLRCAHAPHNATTCLQNFWMKRIIVRFWRPATGLAVAIFNNITNITSGPGSSVGIATELRAGRSGDRIPLGARFSTPFQTGPEAPPSSCTVSTVSFPGVESGRGVTQTPHPLLVSSKNRVALYLYSP
jgi:hypothetical protein